MSVLEELVRRGRNGPRTAAPDTRPRAALHVLDTLGCVAAGAPRPPAAQPARFTARTGDTGELCTPAVAGTPSPRTAVLMEPVPAHAEWCDALHPTAAVVPAAAVAPAGNDQGLSPMRCPGRGRP
ncbi:hypothetical protein [Streptomyces violaceusniger]|uniref:Uncharacterized protein n=1 Tax=Streptomyces violaceusniger (strain Tu 4113) TaxID=653045 RepID=G2NZ30_STRV4|nr:hypothetical protein [Streptomyces violaceusniger]AEM82924.1 hypothetical protein Strvi_3236 [Streptomyces violaceusniger Tu 4113]